VGSYGGGVGDGILWCGSYGLGGGFRWWWIPMVLLGYIFGQSEIIIYFLMYGFVIFPNVWV